MPCALCPVVCRRGAAGVKLIQRNNFDAVWKPSWWPSDVPYAGKAVDAASRPLLERLHRLMAHAAE